MKIKTLLFLGIALLFTACYPLNNTYRNGAMSQSDDSLFHRYSGKSTVNASSSFGVHSRQIEFEYTILEADSLINLAIMLTSGYNEGELTEPLLVELNNEQQIQLPINSMVSREYVDSYNYNTTRPVAQTKVINDPGGTDVVIQADGTHKHVHRPASTKMVNVTENQVVSNTSSKSQIFNQGTVQLTKQELEAIKTHGIKNFVLQLKQAHLKVMPSSTQKQALKRFF